ncbi:hypothetical protein GL2_00750 [Microbulbifer sp. GL-2]|nr:hypothetical protein GL2_00750 [Microbulbifer sp. GL-2]
MADQVVAEKSQRAVHIGICGLGTVGSGTINVLARNEEGVSARCGRPVIVEQVGARRDNPDCETSHLKVTREIFDVANNPEIDILVELIGGTTVARELVITAIENGKHVVTANKALIAEHGNELFELAARQGVTIAYEAAVAGGFLLSNPCARGWLATGYSGLPVLLMAPVTISSRRCAKRAAALLRLYPRLKPWVTQKQIPLSMWRVLMPPISW